MVGRLELAILIGLQASGKSTFRRRFLGDYVVVSKDDFRNARNRQRRQMRLVNEALAVGRCVVVDNTNPSRHEWEPLLEAAHAHAAAAVGYWFPPDLSGALARNAARRDRDRVPDVGLYATLKRLRRPQLSDGFDRLYEVRFDGRGGFMIRPMAEEG